MRDCSQLIKVKCDTKGNVYAGCGDGIHVYSKSDDGVGAHPRPRRVTLGEDVGEKTLENAHDRLLGLGEGNKTDGCANFCFVPGGRLVCFAEEKIYLVDGLAFEGDLLSQSV